jgi:hypothetical protein
MNFDDDKRVEALVDEVIEGIEDNERVNGGCRADWSADKAVDVYLTGEDFDEFSEDERDAAIDSVHKLVNRYLVGLDLEEAFKEAATKALRDEGFPSPVYDDGRVWNSDTADSDATFGIARDFDNEGNPTGRYLILDRDGVPENDVRVSLEDAVDALVRSYESQISYREVEDIRR